MKIENGAIILLENGDKVKVILEPIKENKKVKELIVGKKYFLKYTPQHCHVVNIQNQKILLEDEYSNLEFIYVGNIEVHSGSRYIFYSEKAVYAMYGGKSLDFVVSEVE